MEEINEQRGEGAAECQLTSSAGQTSLWTSHAQHTRRWPSCDGSAGQKQLFARAVWSVCSLKMFFSFLHNKQVTVVKKISDRLHRLSSLALPRPKRQGLLCSRDHRFGRGEKRERHCRQVKCVRSSARALPSCAAQPVRCRAPIPAAFPQPRGIRRHTRRAQKLESACAVCQLGLVNVDGRQ